MEGRGGAAVGHQRREQPLAGVGAGWEGAALGQNPTTSEVLCKEHLQSLRLVD